MKFNKKQFQTFIKFEKIIDSKVKTLKLIPFLAYQCQVSTYESNKPDVSLGE